MSPNPQPGDKVPDDLRQELIDAIEAGNCLFPSRLLALAVEYTRQFLHVDHPTEEAIWEYIVDLLRLPNRWCYTNLDDYPNRWGYAIERADRRRLYVKLMYDNHSRIRVLSFHEGY